ASWPRVWLGGFHIVNVATSDLPKSMAPLTRQSPFPVTFHTVMPVPVKLGGRRIAIAIDEEDQAQSVNEEQARRGRPHAGISIFDVTDYANVKPLSLFEVSELDSPFSRTPGARFGAHQFHERMAGTLVFAVW